MTIRSFSLAAIILLSATATASAVEPNCDPEDQYNRPLTVPNMENGIASHPRVNTVNFWCVYDAGDSLALQPFNSSGDSGAGDSGCGGESGGSK